MARHNYSARRRAGYLERLIRREALKHRLLWKTEESPFLAAIHMHKANVLFEVLEKLTRAAEDDTEKRK